MPQEGIQIRAEFLVPNPPTLNFDQVVEAMAQNQRMSGQARERSQSTTTPPEPPLSYREIQARIRAGRMRFDMIRGIYVEIPRGGEIIPPTRRGIELYCEECERFGLSHYFHFPEGEPPVCCSCATECDDCEEIVPYDDAIRTVSGSHVCESCSGDYFTCDVCNELCSDDDACGTADGDVSLCSGCYSERYVRCEECGGEMPRNGGDTYYRGGCYYCESCYEDTFGFCTACENVYLYSDMTQDEDGDWVCCGCNDEQSRAIHNYSYKPDPIFCGQEPKNRLYFGIELEVENESDDRTPGCNSEIAESMPEFIYCKSDGSLGSYGFEIVAHPATWDWLQENKEKWNAILALRDKGLRSYNTKTCGIHVHLPKKAFSGLHLYKFLKLFYENVGFIMAISQRRQAALREWASLENDDGSTLVYKAANKHGCARHTAVNLTNEETIEVRIFRGNLSEQGFWKNIEFLHAAFHFTDAESVQSINPKAFTLFVKNEKKLYPNLYRFIADKGIQGETVCA